MGGIPATRDLHMMRLKASETTKCGTGHHLSIFGLFLIVDRASIGRALPVPGRFAPLRNSVSKKRELKRKPIASPDFRAFGRNFGVHVGVTVLRRAFMPVNVRVRL